MPHIDPNFVQNGYKYKDTGSQLCNNLESHNYLVWINDAAVRVIVGIGTRFLIASKSLSVAKIESAKTK